MEIKELCARTAHAVNKVYCEHLGDNSQIDWDSSPDWQKQSYINGVQATIDGNTPKQNHDSWSEEKLSDGWKYGEIKDIDFKEHPCLVPYEQLPELQKFKDTLFLAAVKAVYAGVTGATIK